MMADGEHEIKLESVESMTRDDNDRKGHDIYTRYLY